jgi:probable addiction module antidote protein
MSTKFSAFDVAEYLDNDEAIAEYLNEAIVENDSDLFLSALADIARARSMSKVAEDSGLGRESLYKALRPGARPGFATISRIMGALGVRMIAKPMKAEVKAKRAVSAKATKVAIKPRQAKARANA